MHKAKACILLCIDFRFQKQVQAWIAQHGYLGHCDEISVAGSSRDLVKPLEVFHKDALIREISLSVKLHDPEEIIVIEHQDCGGYAQDNTIPSGLSKDDDKNLHLSYANKTKHMIEEIFPDKKVSIFYATLDGDIEPMFV